MKQPSHCGIATRIEVREVSKSYSSQTPGMLGSFSALVLARPGERKNSDKRNIAVEKVSLTIGAGERLGIIGPNGAGKSTLLRMIAGLTTPTSGQIDVRGHVTAVFTLGIGLREDLTGRDNIYIDGELQGKRRGEVDEIINEIIAFADIGEFIDYPLRTYSTGMKSRLAFSMLIHISPEILIIDEALSAGDGFFVDKAKRKIREVCERGKITIIVSHAMQSIVDMCTRCVWLEDGRVVMDGDPQVVTGAYVDSVRKREEATLLEKFHRHIDAQSYREGCRIAKFELRTCEGAGTQVIIHSGEDAELQLRVELDVPVACPVLRLEVRRLDGLVVVESLQEGSGRNGGQPFVGSIGYRIAMRPVVLGAGIYRARIELLDHKEVVATRSIVLEVVADHAPTGGRPVLLYPCSVSVQQVD